jgi:hypothetical protein
MKYVTKHYEIQVGLNNFVVLSEECRRFQNMVNLDFFNGTVRHAETIPICKYCRLKTTKSCSYLYNISKTSEIYIKPKACKVCRLNDDGTNNWYFCYHFDILRSVI